MSTEDRNTLAWHETLEIHELVASQANGLMKLKMGVGKINDPDLKNLYRRGIQDLETNIRELIKFYPSAPIQPAREEERQDLTPFYAGDLLVFSKTSVRNYSIAITETATPALRRTLTNQLLRAIKMHEGIFNYMYSKGYYPSYDLARLLRNDLRNAERALSMRYEE